MPKIRPSRPRLVRIVVAALLLGGVGLAAPTSAAAARPTGAKPTTFKHTSAWYGTNYWLAPKQLQNGDAALVAQSVSAAKQQIGLGWVRAPIYWVLTERTQGSYDWRLTDELVSILADKGLRFYPSLMGAPRWATPWPNSPVPDGCPQPNGGTRMPPSADLGVSAYSDFAAAVARRYGRNGTFWAQHSELTALPVTTYEIWNEANLPEFWCPAPDAALYAELFAGAQSAIRAQQSNARVMIGGLAGVGGAFSWSTFIQTAAANPAFRQASYIGIHSYAAEASGHLAQLDALRSVLASRGMGAAQVFFNEWGWYTTPSQPGAITETDRARRYRETAYRLGTTRCSLAGIANFELISSEDKLFYPDDADVWWGITDPLTGALYASAVAYRDAIADFADGYKTSDVWACA